MGDAAGRKLHLVAAEQIPPGIVEFESGRERRVAAGRRGMRAPQFVTQHRRAVRAGLDRRSIPSEPCGVGPERPRESVGPQRDPAFRDVAGAGQGGRPERRRRTGRHAVYRQSENVARHFRLVCPPAGRR